MKYFCCDERRREVVKKHGTLNGLEYVEVIDRAAPLKALRQRTLIVKLLQPDPGLDASNVRIAGGERIKTVAVEWAVRGDALPAGESPTLIDGLAPLDHFLIVRTAAYGDFSRYTFRLVAAADDDAPPPGFDPRLVEVDFSFKVECDTDFDCASTTACPTAPLSTPSINYLAKDYVSFRRLMLDRAGVLMPKWRERHAADLGVALIELLAYVGDHLSYQQDAVATEAYLGTARRRVSLRRHARLVDYRVDEGSNACAWVRVTVRDEPVRLARGTQMLTRVPDLPDRIRTDSSELERAFDQAEVFESVDDVILYPDHTTLTFYTWGERECCLPKGATSATLREHFPNLKAGETLVFVEEYGPRTGEAEDADRTHRGAVRLTHVRLSEDPSGGLFEESPSADPVPVTEIEWAAEDALEFPLCLSAVTDPEHGSEFLPDVTSAYGNIVLVDHGRTVSNEPLGVVPEARLRLAPSDAGFGCARPELAPIAPRFRPRLAQRPVTHAVERRSQVLFGTDTPAPLVTDLDAQTFSAALRDWLAAHGITFQHGPVAVRGSDGMWSLSDGEQAYGVRQNGARLEVYAQPPPAIQAVGTTATRAQPQIGLTGERAGVTEPWQVQPDLLSSAPDAGEFVVECEHDRSAWLRFGDGVHGRRPRKDTAFWATYRVGSGTAGNVGAESIAHIIANDVRVVRIRNPLPARGGREPESAEAIRRDAPEAFRTLARAVTPEDYATVAGRHHDVQRAAATFRWTGSWHTVFLTADRRGGRDVDDRFESALRRHVEPFRMAGYDLEVDGPRPVALEIDMRVCVKADYFRAHVRAALNRVLSGGRLPDGRPALFHPDNFTFAQRVYLSDVYEAAQAIEGVASVVVDTFQRLHAPSKQPLDEGFIDIGRLEVARLDNDPNFPERGVLRLQVGGGK